MNLAELRTFKPQILAIAQAHGVGNLRVFGSIARQDASDASDIDFLVSIERPMGWEYFGLEPALEALLNQKVDVICDDSIRPRLRERILSDAIIL